MKTLVDPGRLLDQGLARLRTRFTIPGAFPPEVLEAAERAAQKRPDARSHADRTALPFVTLDPASSTDLDQAFAIEPSGPDWLLHYAIADVAWFVEDGDPLDREAWQRGTTTYLPDGKASLYPPLLSEGGASLLPDVERPAVILTVRIDPEGRPRLDGVERGVIRSRAKLAYDTVADDDLPPGFHEIARRIARAEDRRGAQRVDPPEQVVESNGNGTFALGFRPQLPSERWNAALSLATNLAVAQAMIEAGTGLFRVMASPDTRAEERLRTTAQALRLNWPTAMPLAQFQRRLDPGKPAEAAFMLAIRRSGSGASYKVYDPAELPWHAAVAAPYAHATAPLRRLADRYVLRSVLALAKGEAIPERVLATLPELPPVMARAASRDARIDRSVIDLAEATMLHDREGSTFSAVVTDVRENKVQVQLKDLPIVATATAPGAFPGSALTLRLVRADPVEGTLSFEPVD
ncbi:MAG: RNB domain-containing ribonuclease [Novosphingobium sp.]|nr:RNB domain-containing ribonuclease [Novosphingobium sp.]